MNYFLGFFPDDKSNYKIKEVVNEVRKIFNDFDIPIRWVNPENFHISLYSFGDTLNILQKVFVKKKITKIQFKPFEISLGKVRVGISRKYKELVYIDINNGGEELRELLHEIRKVIKGKDSSTFVPHLTIGRVSKDLSTEEYRNLIKDIQNISKQLKVEDISFFITEMYLIKNNEGTYTSLIKFEARS